MGRVVVCFPDEGFDPKRGKHSTQRSSLRRSSERDSARFSSGGWRPAVAAHWSDRRASGSKQTFLPRRREWRVVRPKSTPPWPRLPCRGRHAARHRSCRCREPSSGWPSSSGPRSEPRCCTGCLHGQCNGSAGTKARSAAKVASARGRARARVAWGCHVTRLQGDTWHVARLTRDI